MAWAGPMGRGYFDLSPLISTKLGWLGGKAEHCCTVGAGGRGGGCDQREDCGLASRVCTLSLPSTAPVAKFSLLYRSDAELRCVPSTGSWLSGRSTVWCSEGSRHQGLSLGELRMRSWVGSCWVYCSHTEASSCLLCGLFGASYLLSTWAVSSAKPQFFWR